LFLNVPIRDPSRELAVVGPLVLEEVVTSLSAADLMVSSAKIPPPFCINAMPIAPKKRKILTLPKNLRHRKALEMKTRALIIYPKRTTTFTHQFL
jgi:hypothetical protein